MRINLSIEGRPKKYFFSFFFVSIGPILFRHVFKFLIPITQHTSVLYDLIFKFFKELTY